MRNLCMHKTAYIKSLIIYMYIAYIPLLYTLSMQKIVSTYIQYMHIFFNVKNLFMSHKFPCFSFLKLCILSAHFCFLIVYTPFTLGRINDTLTCMSQSSFHSSTSNISCVNLKSSSNPILPPGDDSNRNPNSVMKIDMN